MRGEHPVRLLCQVLEVAVSGYYRWRTQPRSARALSDGYGYDLSRTCDQIHPSYQFSESCQETVPQAFAAFFDSQDYESTLRLAISLGGDADTLGCIAGGLADAFYRDIPVAHRNVAHRVLETQPLVDVIASFTQRYCV